MVLRARPGRDEGEQAVVHRLASARKAPKDVVERCRMVELSWGGWLVPQIADELRCSQKTVRRWLHRFNGSGLEGDHVGQAGLPQCEVPVVAHGVGAVGDHRTAAETRLLPAGREGSSQERVASMPLTGAYRARFGNPIRTQWCTAATSTRRCSKPAWRNPTSS